VIRLATQRDAMAIVELGERLRSRGLFANTGMDPLASLNHVLASIAARDRWVGVAEHRGQVVGVLMLVAQPYWWNPRARQVLDDLLCCERAGMGRALVRAGLKWALAQRDVVDVILSLNNGDWWKAETVLSRIGLERRGIALGLSRARIEHRRAA
jgi:hypothetical protein